MPAGRLVLWICLCELEILLALVPTDAQAQIRAANLRWASAHPTYRFPATSFLPDSDAVPLAASSSAPHLSPPSLLQVGGWTRGSWPGCTLIREQVPSVGTSRHPSIHLCHPYAPSGRELAALADSRRFPRSRREYCLLRRDDILATATTSEQRAFVFIASFHWPRAFFRSYRLRWKRSRGRAGEQSASWDTHLHAKRGRLLLVNPDASHHQLHEEGLPCASHKRQR